jgi:hypothetical protein
MHIRRANSNSFELNPVPTSIASVSDYAASATFAKYTVVSK